jgi:hypothetical protein
VKVGDLGGEIYGKKNREISGDSSGCLWMFVDPVGQILKGETFGDRKTKTLKVGRPSVRAKKVTRQHNSYQKLHAKCENIFLGQFGCTCASPDSLPEQHQ